MKVTSLEPANDTYQVYPESREIKAVFTNTVDASSLENIVVCANSQVVSADKYTVSSAGNTVSILFNSDLEISTSYKIDYSAVTDESGLVISGDAVQTFRTEEWGAVNISSCKFIKNIGDSASETDSFTASELNGVLVTLNNTSEEKQSATIIYAVYSSEGRLTDTLISKNIVPASNSVTVTQGVKVENNGYIKLFIWDGMNTMRPWTGNILNYVN